MTSKEQIIIDGVNVKDCRRRIGKNSYCRYFKRLCSDNNVNCVWKQLARKKQECEQKDKEINELHLIIDRLLEASGYDKNINSAEDFEDVYADIDYKLGLLDDLKKECEALKSERFTREELISLQENDIARYRKALEEIEEVWAKDEDGDYDFVKWQILDIFSKAKGEGNENE